MQTSWNDYYFQKKIKIWTKFKNWVSSFSFLYCFWVKRFLFLVSVSEIDIIGFFVFSYGNCFLKFIKLQTLSQNNTRFQEVLINWVGKIIILCCVVLETTIVFRRCGFVVLLNVIIVFLQNCCIEKSEHQSISWNAAKVPDLKTFLKHIKASHISLCSNYIGISQSIRNMSHAECA